MAAPPLRRWLLALRAAALLALALSVAGCADAGTPGDPPGGAGGAGGAGGPPVAEPAPDFSLLDVNPASPTANQPVSPRDHLMRVSAWYFGHAT